MEDAPVTPQHTRNDRGELVPGCSCGWSAEHAYYGDPTFVAALADADWHEHTAAH